eukprot:scaffold24543_cov195-Amphora_coffeaeformis.AAC.9
MPESIAHWGIIRRTVLAFVGELCCLNFRERGKMARSSKDKLKAIMLPSFDMEQLQQQVCVVPETRRLPRVAWIHKTKKPPHKRKLSRKQQLESRKVINALALVTESRFTVRDGSLGEYQHRLATTVARDVEMKSAGPKKMRSGDKRKKPSILPLLCFSKNPCIRRDRSVGDALSRCEMEYAPTR